MTTTAQETAPARSRFDYVAYDEDSRATQAAFKTVFETLELLVNQKLHAPRYKALAMTALEEAYAWVGKAVRDDQLERKPDTALQEERTSA